MNQIKESPDSENEYGDRQEQLDQQFIKSTEIKSYFAMI